MMRTKIDLIEKEKIKKRERVGKGLEAIRQVEILDYMQ